MENEEFDIYDDLEEFDAGEKLKEREIEITVLQEKLNSLVEKIVKIEKENQKLTKDKQTLMKNTSSLLKTAKSEIERKDNEIQQTRKEKEDICFRRIKNFKIGKLAPRVDQEIQTDLSFNPFHFIEIQDIKREPKERVILNVHTYNEQNFVGESSISKDENVHLRINPFAQRRKSCYESRNDYEKESNNWNREKHDNKESKYGYNRHFDRDNKLKNDHKNKRKVDVRDEDVEYRRTSQKDYRDNNDRKYSSNSDHKPGKTEEKSIKYDDRLRKNNRNYESKINDDHSRHSKMSDENSLEELLNRQNDLRNQLDERKKRSRDRSTEDRQTKKFRTEDDKVNNSKDLQRNTNKDVTTQDRKENITKNYNKLTPLSSEDIPKNDKPMHALKPILDMKKECSKKFYTNITDPNSDKNSLSKSNNDVNVDSIKKKITDFTEADGFSKDFSDTIERNFAASLGLTSNKKEIKISEEKPKINLSEALPTSALNTAHKKNKSTDKIDLSTVPKACLSVNNTEIRSLEEKDKLNLTNNLHMIDLNITTSRMQSDKREKNISLKQSLSSSKEETCNSEDKFKSVESVIIIDSTVDKTNIVLSETVQKSSRNLTSTNSNTPQTHISLNKKEETNKLTSKKILIRNNSNDVEIRNKLKEKPTANVLKPSLSNKDEIKIPSTDLNVSNVDLPNADTKNKLSERIVSSNQTFSNKNEVINCEAKNIKGLTGNLISNTSQPSFSTNKKKLKSSEEKMKIQLMKNLIEHDSNTNEKQNKSADSSDANVKSSLSSSSNKIEVKVSDHIDKNVYSNMKVIYISEEKNKRKSPETLIPTDSINLNMKNILANNTETRVVETQFASSNNEMKSIDQDLNISSKMKEGKTSLEKIKIPYSASSIENNTNTDDTHKSLDTIKIIMESQCMSSNKNGNKNTNEKDEIHISRDLITNISEERLSSNKKEVNITEKRTEIENPITHDSNIVNRKNKLPDKTEISVESSQCLYSTKNEVKKINDKDKIISSDPTIVRITGERSKMRSMKNLIEIDLETDDTKNKLTDKIKTSIVSDQCAKKNNIKGYTKLDDGDSLIEFEDNMVEKCIPSNRTEQKNAVEKDNKHSTENLIDFSIRNILVDNSENNLISDKYLGAKNNEEKNFEETYLRISTMANNANTEGRGDKLPDKTDHHIVTSNKSEVKIDKERSKMSISAILFDTNSNSVNMENNFKENNNKTNISTNSAHEVNKTFHNIKDEQNGATIKNTIKFDDIKNTDIEAVTVNYSNDKHKKEKRQYDHSESNKLEKNVKHARTDIICSEIINSTKQKNLSMTQNVDCSKFHDKPVSLVTTTELEISSEVHKAVSLMELMPQNNSDIVNYNSALNENVEKTQNNCKPTFMTIYSRRQENRKQSKSNRRNKIENIHEDKNIVRQDVGVDKNQTYDKIRGAKTKYKITRPNENNDNFSNNQSGIKLILTIDKGAVNRAVKEREDLHTKTCESLETQDTTTVINAPKTAIDNNNQKDNQVIVCSQMVANICDKNMNTTLIEKTLNDEQNKSINPNESIRTINDKNNLEKTLCESLDDIEKIEKYIDNFPNVSPVKFCKNLDVNNSDVIKSLEIESGINDLPILDKTKYLDVDKSIKAAENMQTLVIEKNATQSTMKSKSDDIKVICTDASGASDLVITSECSIINEAKQNKQSLNIVRSSSISNSVNKNQVANTSDKNDAEIIITRKTNKRSKTSSRKKDTFSKAAANIRADCDTDKVNKTIAPSLNVDRNINEVADTAAITSFENIFNNDRSSNNRNEIIPTESIPPIQSQKLVTNTDKCDQSTILMDVDMELTTHLVHDMHTQSNSIISLFNDLNNTPKKGCLKPVLDTGSLITNTDTRKESNTNTDYINKTIKNEKQISTNRVISLDKELQINIVSSSNKQIISSDVFKQSSNDEKNQNNNRNQLLDSIGLTKVIDNSKNILLLNVSNKSNDLNVNDQSSKLSDQQNKSTGSMKYFVEEVNEDVINIYIKRKKRRKVKV